MSAKHGAEVAKLTRSLVTYDVLIVSSNNWLYPELTDTNVLSLHRSRQMLLDLARQNSLQPSPLTLTP